MVRCNGRWRWMGLRRSGDCGGSFGPSREMSSSVTKDSAAEELRQHCGPSTPIFRRTNRIHQLRRTGQPRGPRNRCFNRIFLPSFFLFFSSSFLDSSVAASEGNAKALACVTLKMQDCRLLGARFLPPLMGKGLFPIARRHHRAPREERRQIPHD